MHTTRLAGNSNCLTVAHRPPIVAHHQYGSRVEGTAQIKCRIEARTDLDPRIKLDGSKWQHLIGADPQTKSRGDSGSQQILQIGRKRKDGSVRRRIVLNRNRSKDHVVRVRSRIASSDQLIIVRVFCRGAIQVVVVKINVNLVSRLDQLPAYIAAHGLRNHG